MEIRYFQIIIPIISLFLIYSAFRDFRKNKTRINETVLVIVFWIGVTGLALFPDFLSDLLANIFGIKDNINAVIFFALGILFYLQLQLYKTIRKQNEQLTELTRKIALDNGKNS